MSIDAQLEFDWVVEPYDSEHEAPKGDPDHDCTGGELENDNAGG